MKTTTKTIEINLLEKEDIEKILSSHLGEKIDISDVSCTLVHCIPCDTEEPNGAYLEFEVNGEEVDSFDVIWDDDEGCHRYKNKKLRLDEPWVTEEEIFAFDTSLFASFDSIVDGSD